MSESDGKLELDGGGGEGGARGTGGGGGGAEGGVGGIGFISCSDPLPFLKKKIATATTTIITNIQIIKLIYFKNILKLF